eukprot:jgi/Ulvmu1/12100/UM084_0025.1
MFTERVRQARAPDAQAYVTRGKRSCNIVEHANVKQERCSNSLLAGTHPCKIPEAAHRGSEQAILLAPATLNPVHPYLDLYLRLDTPRICHGHNYNVACPWLHIPSP